MRAVPREEVGEVQRVAFEGSGSALAVVLGLAVRVETELPAVPAEVLPGRQGVHRDLL